MIDHIITLDDLVARDEKNSVQAWIVWKCEEALKAKKIRKSWDGSSVEGEPVIAFVNHGRWLGRCKVCANPIYVSPQTPIFYCPDCGNGGSTVAWGVEFPMEREIIEAALLQRPMETIPGRTLFRNAVEEVMNSRPVIAGLARAWRVGISVETLQEENGTAFAKQQGGRYD